MKIARPEDIGALIRNYRAEQGLSQAELAARLQTTQKWISHIENGKPTAQLGPVLRALNELGLTLSVETDGDVPPRRHKRPRFSIDDIVDR
jgi:HTH-type transcriptional regulator/antitoxin HipB